ncbi:MAG: insulinase family protein, partial [Planctomycetes bacterium]|nr:insulinase family protein [Planctomycetota bacterium]
GRRARAAKARGTAAARTNAGARRRRARREERPSFAPRVTTAARKSVDFPVERSVLSNGIPCLVSRNEDVPTLHVQAFVDAGLRFEERGRAGLSALTGSLLEEGAGRRDGLGLARAIESVGGYLGCTGTGVSVAVTGEHWEIALDLLAELLRRPRFDEEAFERRVSMQRSDLLAERDEPRTLALQGIRELVYGRNHPLARPELGFLRDLQALRREDVIAFHRGNYAPDRIVLAAAGNIPDPERFHEHANRVLGRWKHRGDERRPWPRISARATRPRIRCEDRAQVNLYVGHLGVPRRHADYDALLVMDHVLGTGPGFTDRLSKQVRDRLGLAYTVYAGITPTAGSQPGMFLSYVGTKAEYVQLALDTIHREVARIRERKPQRAELELAIDYLVGSHLMAFERNADRVAYMIRAHRLGFPEDHLQTFADRMRAVSAEGVRDVARKHLHPERLAISLVGPVEEIEVPGT